MQGLSASSGPSDSSLWAAGGAFGAAPAAEAVSGLAALRRDRCSRRVSAGWNAGAETDAAPGSWHSAELAASSKCL